MSSRRQVLATVMLMCVLAVGRHGYADENIDDRVAKLCAVAEAAARERDFARVERLRGERLEMLKREAGDSPWVRGQRAIQKAADLIDKLKYKEACDVLRGAWAPFATQPTGPVFGDIALTFFEATQAARIIYPQCLEDGHPSQIATEQEIHDYIQATVERDPCVIEAQAVLAFLTRPDPKEAFTRAEVRPSLQVRNRMLLNISYEGQGPIYPWHAPVEMLKAENFSVVLDDVDFCRSLLYRGVVNRIAGWDARYEPFELVGDSLLLMQLPNKKAYDTPALLYLIPNRKKPEWHKIDMRVLVLDKEAPGEQTKAEVSTGVVDALRRVLNPSKPLSEHRLGKIRLRVFDVPSDEAVDAIHTLPWLGLESFALVDAAIRDAEQYLVAHPAAPSSYLGFPCDDVWYSENKWRVGYWQRKFVYDVAELEADGVVLLLAKETKTAVEPPLFTSSSSHPYLRLKDGRKLVINMEQRRMEISYPSATAYIALEPVALPSCFSLATEDGKRIEEFLAKAGYTDKGHAEKELMKVVRSQRYKPAKLAGKVIPDNVHESVMRLRNEMRGFRYLEDTRGRLLASRESLGGAVSMAASATPYRVFTKEGAELQDTDTQYKAEDYQSLYTNVVGNFLPRAIWLAPSPPLWERLEEELYRMPPPGQGFDWEAHSRLSVYLESPWSKDQGKAPDAISSSAKGPGRVEIAEAIRPDFWKLNCSAYKPSQGQATLRVRGPKGPILEQISHVVLGAGRAKQTNGSSPANTDGSAWERLIAVYHQQAIADALAGRFHRSILGYQDVLLKLDTHELSLDFFRKVPDEKALAAFEILFIDYVAAIEKNVIARAELASVLQAAGLKQSAEFLQRGLLDQFQLSTVPVIDAVNSYAISYGYKEPAQIAVTRQRINAHMASIKKSISGESTRHIASAIDSESFDGQAAAKRNELVTLFKKAEGLQGDEAKETEALIKKAYYDLQQMPRSLMDWLEEKKKLRTLRPQWVVESGRFPQPGVVCPCERFEEKRGFVVSPELLVEGTQAKRFTKWAKSDEASRQADLDSGRFHFLLGWYWLERDDGANARAAFVAAASAYARQGAKDDSIESVVARRNSVLLLIASAAISEMPPGVNISHTQYVNELALQLLMWKRQWVALGYPAAESEREYEKLANVIEIVQALDKESMEQDESPRYFFFDYRFDQGAIPDVLVDAYERRILAAQAAQQANKDEAAATAAIAMPAWDAVVQDFEFPTTINQRVHALGGLVAD